MGNKHSALLTSNSNATLLIHCSQYHYINSAYIMAKKNVEAMIAEAIQNGATPAPENKFVNEKGEPVKVRQMESDYDPLEQGDVLHIPANFTVLQVKFNEDDEKSHPCIFVPVTCADGSDRIIRWFPNSLCKSINPIVDGKRQARVKTTGTATELFRSKDTVDEAVALLAGKDIRVSASTVYTHKTRFTDGERDTHIYQYDIVE